MKDTARSQLSDAEFGPATRAWRPSAGSRAAPPAGAHAVSRKSSSNGQPEGHQQLIEAPLRSPGLLPLQERTRSQEPV